MDTKFSTTGTGTRTSISLSEYKGKQFILIQKEYKKYGSEDWHPGKATTVSFDQWLEFQNNVHQITDVLTEKRLIALKDGPHQPGKVEEK